MAAKKHIKDGTTLGEFLNDVGVDLTGGGQLVTVARQAAAVDQILKEGQTVAVTPTDVRGS